MKKIKQTIKNTVMGIVAVALISSFIFATPIKVGATEKCGGVETAIINCSQSGTGGAEDTGLWGILLIAINILVAGVGVLALGGIIYGAVLYTSAGGNPEQVKKARGIFTNVVIGVIAFGGMYVLLNFLVPGGVFN